MPPHSHTKRSYFDFVCIHIHLSSFMDVLDHLKLKVCHPCFDLPDDVTVWSQSFIMDTPNYICAIARQTPDVPYVATDRRPGPALPCMPRLPESPIMLCLSSLMPKLPTSSLLPLLQQLQSPLGLSFWRQQHQH